MENVNEIWKDVIGYEGLYEVSNFGRVRSLDRTVVKKNMNKRIKGVIMKMQMCKGYHNVRLWKKGKGSTGIVSRLVAQAFIPNPENKREVNHINGIKTNNHISNLEWCTGFENLQHAHRTGLSYKITDKDREKAVIARKKVLSKVVLDTATGVFYDSSKEAAIYNNFSPLKMSRMLTGYQKNKTNLIYV